MMKCLARDFDGDGVMFFCELIPSHDGEHHREHKSGYRRPYVTEDGRRTTFCEIARRGRP